MFRLSAHSILDVLQQNNRLFVAVKGGIAQEHLRRALHRLRRDGHIQEFGSIDEDGRPDFWVRHRRREFLIECKNVRRTLTRREMAIDFMRTRYAATEGRENRFYRPREFHVLAACLFNQTARWEFRYIPAARLARHPDYRNRLDNKVSLAHQRGTFLSGGTAWWER
jgi:hypothetical protein